MAKILAFDIGTKRTGVAETDALQLIATGLTTIPTTDILFFLKDHQESEPVERLIIGEPKRLHGEASRVEQYIKEVITQISRAFPHLKIERIDERFTSKMASQTIAQSGMGKKKRQNKELIDQVSATIILQTWLDRKQ